MQGLLALAEIEQDKKELLSLGLTQEDVDGYKEFFIENFFGLGEYHDLRIPMRYMSDSTREESQNE